MRAKKPFELRAADLELLLTLARAGSLASAAERLAVDVSTVFRGLQRLEQGLREPLFARTRAGLQALERAQPLLRQAEQLETVLEQARAALPRERGAPLQGRVRLTTTDTVLHALLAPALGALAAQHPDLHFELHSGNELASLTRRDADIALRATRQPPPHLIGRRLGVIEVAPYAAPDTVQAFDAEQAALWPWVAPDDGLPDHPSVRWRRRQYPRLQPRFSVSSVQAVAELVARGLGVGLLPMFLAEGRSDLQRLGPPLADCATELWLLTHPELRSLRRVAAVVEHLGAHLQLPAFVAN